MGATPSGPSGGASGASGAAVASPVASPAANPSPANPVSPQPQTPSSTPGQAAPAAPAAPKPGDGAGGGEGAVTRDPQTGQFVKGPAGPIKPIKPRIPGLTPSLPKDSPLSETPDIAKGFLESITASGLTRPATGREQEPTPPPPKEGQPGEQAPDPNAPAGEFVFGDVKFKDRAAAEQNFRSLRGSYKSLNEKATRAEQFGIQANDSARLWREKALALEAGQSGQSPSRPAAGQGGSQPGTSPAAPGTPESVEQAFDQVDLGLYNTISEQQGPVVAAAWLFREGMKKAGEFYKVQFDQLRKPIQSAEKNAQMNTAAQTLIYNAGQAQTQGADGQLVPLYPELSDPTDVEGIAEIWSQLPISEDQRLTPVALHMAVLGYRDYRARYPKQDAASLSTPDGSGVPNPAQQLAAAVTAQLASASPADVVTPGSSLPSSRPTSPSLEQDEGQQVIRSMRESSTPDPVLGFVTGKKFRASQNR